MGRKKPTARDEENGEPIAATAGNAKKKGYVVADDEYSMGNEILDDASVREDNKMAPISSKKKGKKGGPKKLRDEDVDEEVATNDAGEEDEDGDAPVVSFSGKKKSKDKKSSKGSVFASSNFGLLEEDEEEKGDDDDEREISAGVDEEPDTSVVEFFGKKKPSKSKKKNVESMSSFNLLEEDDQEVILKDVISEEEEEDVGITFTGKKKKKQKKPSGSSFSVALLEPENNDDDSFSKPGNNLDGRVDLEHEEVDAEINFTGKKKSSRKKNIVKQSTLDVDDADAPTNFVEPDQNVDESKARIQVVDAVPVTSKNKKKKKKGGKLGQEEDDLDKILAEIDGPQVTSKDVSEPSEVAAPLEKREPDQPEIEEVPAEKNADGEGPAETAAAKKKKKKKEKEKEKKAAASTPATEEKNEGGKIEATSKISGMKVPKHVREMQEKLARLKEAEEKKKREEEERLRKEEEERRRQEELERLAEEKKRLKKEREKEKIQKKKQEGTYLTQKEKIEARKREMLRNQLLANSGGITLPSGETAAVSAKRPIYQKKKGKPLTQPNGSATSENAENQESKETQLENQLELESVESENANEPEPSSANQKSEGTVLFEENGVDREGEEDDSDDDEEWDAKSWENADLNLNGTSAFADEEIDMEPQPIANKAAGLTGKALAPPRTEHVDIRKKDLDFEGTNMAKIQTHVNLEKRSKKEAPPKEELPKSDVLPAQSGQNLRSPICCIMGHVDTGKTKLLDCIRGTNVQEGEAGGITQQIGATYFPAENIRDRTRELKADAKLNVPGLLVIDTPGHESFTNLRSRGSGLCDIAILVVDIMHGLEPQTIESLNLLKLRNTEFIVALNKVDRLYGWKTCRNAPIIKAIKQQSRDVQMEFETRLTDVKTQFMMEGLNTELYYKNKEMGETYNIVPTSAISGEGVPDLLLLLVQWAQKTMIERLTFRNEVECTVLEVKVVEGHGTTIDVVLVNGVLHEGDQIVVCGLQGPIVTTIRALLTPHPMKELRVKGTYLHHKEIKAAQGIKITAQGLEHAVAGTSLYVVGPDDDLEDIKGTAMEDMKSIMSRIDKSGEGVYVQASTLGSLEALLEFLKSPAVNIPVSGISIGPVHKKDVMKASVMLEKKKEYGTILAFDVKVTQEARELADEYGVKIFIADIIYHLFDQFKAYIDDLKEEKKKEAAGDAVFPCVLKIVPGCVFNKKDPIVLGVDVIDGIMKIGTPLCVPQKDFIDIGCISSIENNHKPVDFAKKGEKVAIKVVSTNPEDQKIFGRHFEIEDELVSKISRNSLDALKEHYASELSKDITRLLFTLKKVFKIP